MPHKLELVLYLFCLFKPRASIAHCLMWPLPYLPELRWRTRMNLRCPWCRSDITIVMQLYSWLDVAQWFWFYCYMYSLQDSFTAKFQYLQIPTLLPVLTNSSTCKFHPCFVYWHIPVLANSTSAAFTGKFITCIFHAGKKICFTSKFQYLQIPVKRIYCQNPVPAISITCKFIQPEYLTTQLSVCNMSSNGCASFN